MRILKPLIIAMMFAAIVCCGACSTAGGENNKSTPTTATDTVSIDGIFVDDSWADEESNQLKRVYLFYTLSPDEENLEADSKYTDLIVNNKNTYTGEHYPDACDYMPSYYYSDFIEDVYMGSELKVATVFEIPEADLAAGRTISIKDDQIPTIEKISLSTDDIVHCASVEEIAQKVDPDGYQQALNLRNEADSATTKRVRNAINGYYWSFFVNNMSYTTEFFAPNKFTTTLLDQEVSGTYTVTNGFVILRNDSNGFTVEVPYAFDGGEIELDLPTAYSVYE